VLRVKQDAIHTLMCRAKFYLYDISTMHCRDAIMKIAAIIPMRRFSVAALHGKVIFAIMQTCQFVLRGNTDKSYLQLLRFLQLILWSKSSTEELNQLFYYLFYSMFILAFIISLFNLYIIFWNLYIIFYYIILFLWRIHLMTNIIATYLNFCWQNWVSRENIKSKL